MLFLTHALYLAVIAVAVLSSPVMARADSPTDDFQVILIEDSFVYMNAGRDRGVQVGDQFTVTRPGKAIVDPRTGDTLGSEPISIARIRAQYAAPHYSRCYAVEVVAEAPLQVGDRIVRWDGERIGRVPAAVVVPLERAEAAVPTAAVGKVDEGDRIFKETKQRRGDVTGDFTFDGEFLDYDFGDVDGDGISDLAAVEERKVTVFKVVGGTTEVLWKNTIKGFQYVAMELFDADGDGRAEIFVGQKQSNMAKTEVYKYKDGHMIKTGEIKGILVRQIGAALHAQRYGFAKPFMGPVMEIRYDPSTNAVSKQKDVGDGPYNVLDLGIGKNRMAYIDFNDRLTVLDRTGQPVWRGTRGLGGSSQELASGNGREKLKVQKKIVFDDFNTDGVEDLLVVQNELNPLWGFTGVFGGGKFKNGKFVIYSDRPGGYDVLRETRDFEGYISDYEYGVVGGREKQLSLCLVIPAGREKFKSRIIVLREL